MLRISTIDESEQRVRLALEGWLVGPWVDELRKQSEQQLSEAKALRLDLAKVLFVDPRGVALLRELAGRQVTYVNCSPFLSRQLKEATIWRTVAIADCRELNSAHTPLPEIDSKVARERELIERVLAGEKDLFYELIRPYERGVFLAAASILRNDADAEDAAQEAFLKAYRNLARFRQESKFSTWLIQIAINDARMRLRKDRRHLYEAIDAGEETSEDGYIPTDFADWREIPSEALEQSELREALKKALNSLPAKYRTVLILRDVQQMSIAETAKALGISKENVKTRTSRARLQMRDRLALGWSGAWAQKAQCE
ncbi:MAG TPA: sigma-70 family RNA polymerase sigma factor [Candidatus Acidoferrum sp.]